MHITIFTAGSQGDVRPCMLLGRGLQRAGFRVTLAAPQNFTAQAQEFGLPFHPLRGDVQQVMAGDAGRRFMQSGGGNPVAAMLAMRRMIGPLATAMAEDALDACRDADALISLAVFAPFGRTIAEVRGIPLINVEPTPLLPTAAFPAPGWPLQRDLGPALNRFSGAAMLRLIWGWYGPYVNRFRRRFGLKAFGGGDFERTLRSNPLLGAYSPNVIPQPTDWPDRARITGYWFEDRIPDWKPPAGLEAFLERGEPPVYIGFGSMGGRSPATLAALVLEALVLSGRRGLLLTGWGGLQAGSVPESVFVLPSAPHAWLFPRTAAVVHHGGAGTTAEGLRAGRPTVIVPFIVDQPFWGRRVQTLGVGPPAIPAKKLTAVKLAAAISAAATDPALSVRAATLGAALGAECGVERAVEFIRSDLEGRS